ncbi:MAG: replication and repair protein RecF protein [Parcubacteria group bacterium GW2011_GWA2_51_12]|nr:MAG: replication and repair protein RecF protein [Parcubacteria group bacterium GW2011_GWA2_51_12]
MHISKIHLTNFRNFSSLDLPVDQGLVVISGPNGAGKTNFLEGIYFGTSLRRFPESHFSQLVKLGEDFFNVNLEIKNGACERLEVFWQSRPPSSGLLRTSADQQKVTRAKYAGEVPVISFLPQDLVLLTRSPQNRRRFLNEALSAASASYREASAQYERALRQRNSLWATIAMGQAGEADLEIWDEQLAENGSVVSGGREDFLARAQETLPEILAALSPTRGLVELKYLRGGASNRDEFRSMLLSARDEERRVQTTLVGPHRDDFTAEWEGQSVAGFLSRGQIRSLTLALKIFQRQFLEELKGRSPILLLDDVFSEFDETHQRTIGAFLETFPQVFLTSANLEMLRDLIHSRQTFLVEAGEFKPRS